MLMAIIAVNGAEGNDHSDWAITTLHDCHMKSICTDYIIPFHANLRCEVGGSSLRRKIALYPLMA